jgi:hypothetical protein
MIELPIPIRFVTGSETVGSASAFKKLTGGEAMELDRQNARAKSTHQRNLRAHAGSDPDLASASVQDDEQRRPVREQLRLLRQRRDGQPLLEVLQAAAEA